MRFIGVVLICLFASSIQAQVSKAWCESEAVRVFEWFKADSFDAVYSRFDKTMKRQIQPDMLEGVWGQVTMSLGLASDHGEAVVEEMDSLFVTLLPIKLQKGKAQLKVTFDKTGLIAGLFIVPGQIPYSPPAWLNPEKIKEVKIDFGEPQFPNSGKLSMPASGEPFACVIIVPGSGGIDKDCSIGPNKIYKDIAWGLASKGIASFRYDKRTHDFLGQLVKNDQDGKEPFDIRTEYLQDLKEIVKKLAKRPELNAKRIYILGHSQGGALIPLFNKELKGIAGFISMAGTLRPIPELAKEQVAYLSSFSKLSKDDSLKLEQLYRKFDNSMPGKIENLDKNEPIFEPYTHNYWKFLAKLDMPKMAVAIKKPMLFLQGERDYQVTMKDFELWKSTLKGKSDCTFKSYPKLNHLFLTGRGEGPSDPNEYNRPENVSEEVILDLVNWLKSRP